MSRLRKLKKRKKKQYTKTIMSSLALTIAIGYSQTMTTYAWFTGTENIQNDLIVTMGKLDVEIKEGLNVQNLKLNKLYEKEFKINNLGSLKQKLRLKFSKGEYNNIEKEHLKYISYTLSIKTSKNKNVIINNLNNNEVELLNSDGTKLVLDSGDYLNCKSQILIKDTEDNPIPEDIKKSLSKKIADFNIAVLASQISYDSDGNIENNHIGFTDRDIQHNVVRIDKLTSCEDLEVEFDENRKEIDINIPKEYEDNKKLDLVKVDILGGTGEFENVSLELENGVPDIDSNEFDIVKMPLGSKFDPDKIGNCFTENQKLMVELTFKQKIDNTEVIVKETWKIKFRMGRKSNGKKVLQACYEVLDRNKEELILTNDEEKPMKPELPKEEVEVPSEPEVEESPKEEVEIPSKPDKDDSHKAEDTDIPSKPDIIEQSKEEIEIQE